MTDEPGSMPCYLDAHENGWVPVGWARLIHASCLRMVMAQSGDP